MAAPKNTKEQVTKEQVEKALGDTSGKSSINDATEWAKMRGEWSKEQIDKIHAHADRFFMVDDDMSLSPHIILVAVAIFFMTFIGWACYASLDEVTRGQGKVVPPSDIQKVQSLEGGIVEEFMVVEGGTVKVGQVLMRLRDVQASSDLGSQTNQYMSMKAKVERLRAEAEGQIAPEFTEDVMKAVPSTVKEELETFKANQTSMRSQLNVLDQQMDQRREQVKELETRIYDLRGLIRISNEERDMIAPLVARGSAPKMEMLQLERGIKERQSELNGALSRLPQAKSAASEVQARVREVKDAMKAQAQAELSATQIEMNTIKETLSALKDRKVRTEIRSPVNGTIKDLKVSTVGGVVQPGQDLVEIVPMDDQLIVEVQIRPSDIAFLHPDQDAVVKITAYDFAIYGGLKGQLVDISPDSITDEQGETFYRVRIRTDQTSLKRHGEVLNIIPGMTASVDILTGEKTVMEYILKPLIKTLDNAMNER